MSEYSYYILFPNNSDEDHIKHTFESYYQGTELLTIQI